MTPLEQFAEKLFVINRDARTDRKAQYEAEFEKHGITRYERFQAYDHANINGYVGGNGGCVASHRGVLEIIAYLKCKWAIVFEDDVQFRFNDMQDRFASMIGNVPDDADILYLGGHYGSDPQYRVNEYVIRVDTMLTTSSYAITGKFARWLAPHIFGSGPIDSLFSAYLPQHKAYCLEPRLAVQREGFSDLQGRVMDNRECMENDSHVQRLDKKRT